MPETGYQKSQFCLKKQRRKISDICLKQGQGMRGRAASPTQGYTAIVLYLMLVKYHHRVYPRSWSEIHRLLIP